MKEAFLLNSLIERLSIKHWPAITSQIIDGWQVNISEGYTKRANCIQYANSDNEATSIEQKIEHFEQLYSNHHLPTIFKLTSFTDSALLDMYLDQRGYKYETESLVLSMELTEKLTKEFNSKLTDQLTNSQTFSHVPVKAEHVILSPEATDDWKHFFYEQRQFDSKTIAVHEKIVNQIEAKTCYITLAYEGHVVAAGIGVLEDHHLGIYCLYTSKAFRQHGFATTLLLHLFQWAKQHGATHSYILVNADNEPATNLYYKLGYKLRYSYWYRVKQFSHLK